MIAVSVRFSTDPDVRACSEKWRHEARKHVILHAAETTDIASLQALSIIVLDVIGSGSNPETWGLREYKVLVALVPPVHADRS